MELPQSEIDILKGPEKGNLLYIGQEEERRLHLKSYKQQLEELALRGQGEDSNDGKNAAAKGQKKLDAPRVLREAEKGTIAKATGVKRRLTND